MTAPHPQTSTQRLIEIHPTEPYVFLGKQGDHYVFSDYERVYGLLKNNNSVFIDNYSGKTVKFDNLIETYQYKIPLYASTKDIGFDPNFDYKKEADSTSAGKSRRNKRKSRRSRKPKRKTRRGRWTLLYLF